MPGTGYLSPPTHPSPHRPTHREGVGSRGAKTALCTQQYIIQLPTEDGQKDRWVKLRDEPGFGDEPGTCEEGVPVNFTDEAA